MGGNGSSQNSGILTVSVHGARTHLSLERIHLVSLVTTAQLASYCQVQMPVLVLRRGQVQVQVQVQVGACQVEAGVVTSVARVAFPRKWRSESSPWWRRLAKHPNHSQSDPAWNSCEPSAAPSTPTMCW